MQTDYILWKWSLYTIYRNTRKHKISNQENGQDLKVSTLHEMCILFIYGWRVLSVAFPVHAIKAGTGSRDVAPLMLSLGTWVVNFTPQLLQGQERSPVPTEHGWVAGLFWRTENLVHLNVQPAASCYTDYTIPAPAQTTWHQTVQWLMNNALKSMAKSVAF